MGQRYREYLQGTGGGKKTDAVYFNITGIDETIKVFEQIRDKAMAERKIVMAIRRVLKRYYIPTIQGLALSLGPKIRGNKLSQSYGLLETLSKPYINRKKNLVGVRAGARYKPRYRGKSFFPDLRSKRKQGGRSNFGGGGWLAGIYEGGTTNRKTDKGINRGKIRPTKYHEIAFKRSKHIVERMLREKIQAIMEKEFAFASRGMIRKIPMA